MVETLMEENGAGGVLKGNFFEWYGGKGKMVEFGIGLGRIWSQKIPAVSFNEIKWMKYKIPTLVRCSGTQWLVSKNFSPPQVKNLFRSLY